MSLCKRAFARKRTQEGGPVCALSPGMKAAAGCFLAAAVMFLAGLISVLGMNGARNMLGRMTEESLPRLEAAVLIEHQVYATMAHLSVYSLTGDMTRYSLARELLANIKLMTEAEGASTANGAEFREKILPVWELIRKLDRLIEEDRALTENLALHRKNLREAVKEAGDARNLSGPAQRVLAASAQRDREDLEAAEKALAAASPEAVSALAAAKELRQNLDASLALDKSRIAILDALAVEVRGVAQRSAAEMGAAAKNAETALHGAILTLIAAVGLGVALAGGAAVLLLRRARAKEGAL